MSMRHLRAGRALLVAAIGSTLLLMPFSLPRLAVSTTREETPFDRAMREHQLLFGDSSSALLIDPDRYLSATGFDTEAAQREILGRINSLQLGVDLSVENLPAVTKAVTLVEATTGFLGPATIRVESISAIGDKPIVLIVSHDTARPFQVALHSLADLDDPTVNLMPSLTFEEFQSFTRFHESAHAFQHLNGLHGEDASDVPFLHAHEEAEADAFAVLVWFKLREADERVPKLWFALRISRYIEMLRTRRFDPAIEYYTHTSVKAALAEAQKLHRSGELSSMDGNALYFAARRIVKATIPSEDRLKVETRQIATALEKLDRYPLRKRIVAIEAGADSYDAATASTLKEYTRAMRDLLEQSEPREKQVDQQALALRCWCNQLECDLARTKHHALVLERLQIHLAGESLNLAFSSTTDEEKRTIKTDGDRFQPFVPIDAKYGVLEALRNSPTP